MNFNLVEGQSSRLSVEDFDDFKNDYLHSTMTTNEVRKKYDLSKKEYAKLTKIIREEVGIQLRPRNNAKRYYKQGRFWIIKKQINGERHAYYLPFGCFSEDEVIEIVKKFEKKGWAYRACSNYVKGLKKSCRII